ncbi:MAG: amino acid synthesis family protein [Alphaproteobacteria bacterium]|nr:amino acid synthesis family protein [Alphaproteobacteria bacterium]MCW5741072.1 amino acid synthesis family protein [Alphaproteobacteria bacterium]
MKAKNLGEFHVRKWYLQIEDTLANESGVLADGEPVRKIVIGAAIHNAFSGRFVEDLSGAVRASGALGQEFGNRLKDVIGNARVASYGKACVVGAAGEYEHGNALLTTVFADPVRHAIGGGAAWIPSTGKRGSPGTAIDIPLAHKDELYMRSHYDTVSVMFTDAPNADEIVIAFAFATRGRLHARLGGPRAEPG